jgi:NADH dehydrogenase/NADH:ubiquinone oxidoreductase subunit G
MSLEEFIAQFDKENAIVLLEGKRAVLPQDEAKLVALGTLLASKTKHMLFRSGNAAGSDQLFSDGVTAIDHKRLQVITPYTGHRKKTNNAYDTISLQDLNMIEESELVMQSKSNKKMEQLIDQYAEGNVNQASIKAAYIIRDTAKVIGANNIPAASFGIFYDDLLKPRSGGTGHTMNICILNDIPYVDQQTWFKWLAI